jgi:DNA-binding NarL/FixJ family response regulator
MPDRAEPIQIVIVDDHPLFRDGVVNTLNAQPGIEVIGEGASAADALRLAGELLPDILLLDISMPGDGRSAVSRIAAVAPVTRIVMLTASEHEEDVTAALKAGARGYIVKGVSARELVGVVRAVHAGEVYVTPSLAATLLFELTGAPSRPRAGASPLDELTERERQILERVAAGDSNKEIGAALAITEKTVKHHMTNILQKLQVRNRVEAAMLAQKDARGD